MKPKKSVLQMERAIAELCRAKKWDPRDLRPAQVAAIASALGHPQRTTSTRGR